MYVLSPLIFSILDTCYESCFYSWRNKHASLNAPFSRNCSDLFLHVFLAISHAFYILFITWNVFISPSHKHESCSHVSSLLLNISYNLRHVYAAKSPATVNFQSGYMLLLLIFTDPFLVYLTFPKRIGNKCSPILSSIKSNFVKEFLRTLVHYYNSTDSYVIIFYLT